MSSLAVSHTVGGLVKKILETKKDYELSPSSPKSKEQVCKSQHSFYSVTTRGKCQTSSPAHPDQSLRTDVWALHQLYQPFFLECALPWVTILTAMKYPVQCWLLSKEGYKQMEWRGVIALPQNQKMFLLQWSWRTNNQTNTASKASSRPHTTDTHIKMSGTKRACFLKLLNILTALVLCFLFSSSSVLCTVSSPTGFCQTTFLLISHLI